MKNITISIFTLGILILLQSCNDRQSTLFTTQKESIIDSARVTVQNVFDASNDLKFLEGLNYYSGDSDTYYTNNGSILTLGDLKESYSQISSSVEVLENKIDSWNATFLSQNTVAFTLPVRLKIKLKDKSEYNGQLVWSGIVQRRNDEWMIVQSHESWLNCVEALQALTPAGFIEE